MKKSSKQLNFIDSVFISGTNLQIHLFLCTYSLGQDTISSVSSHNDADSSDERRSTQFSPSENQNSQNSNADEDNGDISLDIPNEVPRTRVVPFIMSPLPLPMSYRSQIDPPDPLEPPLTSTNNNMSAALQYVENPDDLTADRDVE